MQKEKNKLLLLLLLLLCPLWIKLNQVTASLVGIEQFYNFPQCTQCKSRLPAHLHFLGSRIH